MVKTYQRYVLSTERKSTLGVIISTSCKDILWADKTGNLVLAPALDTLNLWNIRTGAVLASMRPENVHAEITSMALSSSGTLIATGYFDGSVRVWNRETFSLQVTLEGHKSSVTSIVFNSDDTMLASGSLDTDIILWDVVGESGRFRLRGHKDAVTCIEFFSTARCGEGLVTGSKDGLIKIWDLMQQHCVQTLTGHRGAIWCLALNSKTRRLVTAGADAELRIWTLEEVNVAAEDVSKEDLVSYVGCVAKGSQSRSVTLQFFGPGGNHLMCQTADRKVEIYRFREVGEALKKMRRRVKRAREKALAHREAGGEVEAAEVEERVVAGDEMERVAVVSTDSKIRGACVLCPGEAGGEAKLVCGLVNNSVQVFWAGLAPGAEARRAGGLHMAGHHSDVRAVGFSGDEATLASCAGGEVKLWRVESGACVGTVETGYGVCLAFAPGDKYLLVGTKAGRLQLVDLAAATLAADIEAHQGCLWSLAVRPDGRGVVSAGADKHVKFWDFRAGVGEGGQACLDLGLTKEASMDDDVLAMAYSGDGKLLALALLDATVKVFAADSMRFLLSLYGHRLPVLALDISSDSRLIVTGSADKNVKIWGLDFGDCHRSLLAHEDSVMAVRFIPQTHYFVTAGKDRAVKMWDADKMLLVARVGRHYAEVWALAVSPSGSLLASGGHDRAVRLWTRTDEPVFVEEERAREREETWDAEEHDAPAAALASLAGDESAPAGAGRAAAGALDAADRLEEALRLCADPPGAADAGGAYELLLGLTPNAYFRRAVTQLRPAELEAALATLPFDAAVALLARAAAVLEEARASGGGPELEPLARAVAVVVRLHHARLALTPAALAPLQTLRAAARGSLRRRADLLGFNLAGLRSLRRRLAADEAALPA